MPDVKIAVALSCLRQPFRKALHTVASLGATGVEIDARNDLIPSEISDTGRRQLRKMLNDLNLSVASVRFPTRRGYDVAEDLERRLEATKQAMTFAYSLGAKVVVNAVGRIPENSEQASLTQLATSLSDLARFGDRVGTVFACETGSEPVQRLANFLSTLNTGAIGIHYNPAALILADCYETDSIRHCAQWVQGVTVRDAVRDRARLRGVEVEIGRGSAEFPEILGVLEEHNYTGWYVIDRPPSANSIPEIRNALSYLKSL